MSVISHAKSHGKVLSKIKPEQKGWVFFIPPLFILMKIPSHYTLILFWSLRNVIFSRLEEVVGIGHIFFAGQVFFKPLSLPLSLSPSLPPFLPWGYDSGTGWSISVSLVVEDRCITFTCGWAHLTQCLRSGTSLWECHV